MASKRLHKFVKHVAAGKNDLEAARASGYAESTARNTAQKVWRQRRATELYKAALQRAGNRVPLDDHEPQRRQEPGLEIWWTFFLRNAARGLVRIASSSNVEPCLRKIMRRSADPLQLVHILAGDRQREFQIRFAEQRVRGYWFREQGPLAAFLIDPEIPWEIESKSEVNHAGR